VAREIPGFSIMNALRRKINPRNYFRCKWQALRQKLFRKTVFPASQSFAVP
jgi:hypothetical protein